MISVQTEPWLKNTNFTHLISSSFFFFWGGVSVRNESEVTKPAPPKSLWTKDHAAKSVQKYYRTTDTQSMHPPNHMKARTLPKFHNHPVLSKFDESRVPTCSSNELILWNCYYTFMVKLVYYTLCLFSHFPNGAATPKGTVVLPQNII